jgi:hypothetical protein
VQQCTPVLSLRDNEHASWKRGHDGSGDGCPGQLLPGRNRGVTLGAAWWHADMAFKDFLDKAGFRDKETGTVGMSAGVREHDMRRHLKDLMKNDKVCAVLVRLHPLAVGVTSGGCLHRVFACMLRERESQSGIE